MTTETSLIALEDISADKAPAIYGYNKLTAYVEAARAAVAGEVPDLTTRKGRERVASLAAQVARSKTAVEKPGREYLKRIKELPRTIEAELREFVDEMDALRDEVRRPLTEWEAAEKARVAGHENEIQILRDLAMCADMDAAGIESHIEIVEAVAIGEAWEEFEAEAHRVKAASLTALREALAKRQQYEAEQAELERLRREAAEREQKEREERIAREAAERAQREAEQRAQAEREAAIRREQEAKAEAERRELQLKLQAEQAEREKLEAQQRAEQAARDADARAKAAAEAERQRIADEQARAEAEAKAREADKAHKAAINRAALEAFVAGGMTEECAKQAIVLIAQRKIPNIQISY
jgi:chromosome segregation ATPase